MVDPDDIECWVSQDLLKTCASFEPVSEQDYCQIGMTAIVMGDVNAVCTLECAHRRQLLAARALNERSRLTRSGDSSSRAQRRLEMYTLMTLSFSVLCNCRSAACRCFVRLPPNANECGQVWQYTRGGVLGRTPRRRCKHSRILLERLERRVSLMLITMPPRRVFIRPRFRARSIRLPRRGLHCSRDSGSKQTMSSEWGSVRRATLCHRTRSFVGDELEGRTLRDALRYRRLTRWRWRVNHRERLPRLR